MTPDEKTEDRYKPEILRQYEGDGVVVHWEPALCIHVAACIRNQPGVFDPNARPWVNATAATANDIAAAIEACPTGALRYERTDGGPQEQPPVPASIQPRLNGPLFVQGDVDVVDTQGNTVRRATRIALCRCGQSQNKPYCDLSHRATGFKS
ncbi:MAG: (4Fe-4S)-binding protein [Dehalococcoidia bacterium]